MLIGFLRPYAILFAFLFLLSCIHSAKSTKKVIVIAIQPFGGFDKSLAENVYEKIKVLHPDVILKSSIEIPVSCYYAPRKRYRADKIIQYLHHSAHADTVMIGLTDFDISTTKGNRYDWGVMGLGYCPGNACVVSTFRLSKTLLKEQFYKVVIHELGHTQGLPHCAINTCFMRDAEGGNPLNEEVGFCQKCKPYMKSKGWNLK